MTTSGITKPPKRSRINMRIPADLIRWAKKYLRQKNRSLTQEFIDHLTKLKEDENRKSDASSA